MGQHLVLDAWRASEQHLDDPEFVQKALEEAVERSGATLINVCVHQFSPFGVTATATLAESHMAIHTWPEHGYLGADVFFCGEGQPKQALEFLVERFEAKEFQIRYFRRGIRPEEQVGDLQAESVESA